MSSKKYLPGPKSYRSFEKRAPGLFNGGVSTQGFEGEIEGEIESEVEGKVEVHSWVDS